VRVIDPGGLKRGQMEEKTGPENTKPGGARLTSTRSRGNVPRGIEKRAQVFVNAKTRRQRETRKKRLQNKRNYIGKIHD